MPAVAWISRELLGPLAARLARAGIRRDLRPRVPRLARSSTADRWHAAGELRRPGGHRAHRDRPADGPWADHHRRRRRRPVGHRSRSGEDDRRRRLTEVAALRSSSASLVPPPAAPGPHRTRRPRDHRPMVGWCVDAYGLVHGDIGSPHRRCSLSLRRIAIAAVLAACLVPVAPAQAADPHDPAGRGGSAPGASVHYEDAQRHAGERIDFKPGGRVTVAFKPRPGRRLDRRRTSAEGTPAR